MRRRVMEFLLMPIIRTALHPCLKSLGCKQNADLVQDLLGKMELIDSMENGLRRVEKYFLGG